MATRIQLRRDTAANWISANPILSSGEFGYETDGIKYKIGDGVTAWNSLTYFSGLHSDIGNLDYASAGHTGFASTDALTSTSGVLQTNIDANTALITTISGELDDHSEMNGLDYASAGHTGFQPAGDYATNTDLTTVSGLTDTNAAGIATNASDIADNTTLIATTSGTLQDAIDTKSSTLLELTDTPAAYNNEKYLKSTASGTEWVTILYPDSRHSAGEDWTSRTSAADNSWHSVCWSPELTLFVAVAYSGGSGNRVMTSSDGINWDIQSSAAGNSWHSVCWSPELTLFVAVASTGSGNRVMTSPDGINWDTQSSAADNYWRSVCWSPELTLFVAVASGDGTGNRVMTSSDGINWGIQSSAADNDWYGVCWSPELTLFVAIARSGSGNRVMTSPDGINWDTQSSAADNDWWGVCWSPELTLFVAVAGSGAGNRVMTSPDGINWGTQSSAADNSWHSVCWSPELILFVAVAYSGTGNRVMTSPDGINWDIQVSAADIVWRSVCWSPELDLFVAVSQNGYPNQIMTSGMIINHSELKELDYASAGHTGFQPAGDYATNTDLTTVSGLTDTNASAISDNTTLIATTSGSLQNEIDTKSSTLLELTDTPEAYDVQNGLLLAELLARTQKYSLTTAEC